MYPALACCNAADTSYFTGRSALTACGGGSTSPAPMTPSTSMTPSTYLIGGMVTLQSP
jgi:hypothetical protein